MKKAYLGIDIGSISTKGVVIDQNLLTGKLTVRLDKNPDAAPGVYKVKDVRVIRDGQIKLNKKEIEAFKKLEK